MVVNIIMVVNHYGRQYHQLQHLQLHHGQVGHLSIMAAATSMALKIIFLLFSLLKVAAITRKSSSIIINILAKMFQMSHQACDWKGTKVCEGAVTLETKSLLKVTHYYNNYCDTNSVRGRWWWLYWWWLLKTVLIVMPKVCEGGKLRFRKPEKVAPGYPKGGRGPFFHPFKQILPLNTHYLQTVFGTERFSVTGQLSLWVRDPIFPKLHKIYKWFI